MRYKKRRKSSRYRGTHTHARGFKKKARGSGHRGGVGMAGTGKRGDQLKSYVLNLYGNDYFGKSKTLRRGNVPRKLKEMNLHDINDNISSLVGKGAAKESKDGFEINLKGYKILSSGDIKFKAKIIASAASSAAVEKVKKAKGEIILA